MRSIVRISIFVTTGLAISCSGGVSCGIGVEDEGTTATSALHGGGGGGDDNNGHRDHKVTICHATGSATNPYVEITIDEHAVDAHRHHQNGEDIIPAPADGCPGAVAGEGEGAPGGEGEGEGCPPPTPTCQGCGCG